MNIVYIIALYCIFIPLSTGSIVLFLSYIKRKKNKNTSPLSSSLLFHSIADKRQNDQSHISKKTFAMLIANIKKKEYTTITGSDLLSPRKSVNQSEKKIALVFDDGFENVFTNAFPLMQEYSIKSNVFPIVDSIGKFSSWDIYKSQKHMSKEHVRKISDAGHEIGSHSLTHQDLVLISHKEAEYELSESKKILEDITGREIVSISFPWGSWNKRTWDLALQCGYKIAFAYRGHSQATFPVIPVTGVYSFDSVSDIIEKIEMRHSFSNTIARSLIMPHFARGTALWKFKKNYNIMHLFE